MAFIEISDRSGVRFISLNRPEVHNAFHPAMIAELTEAFLAIQSEPSLRAVVLQGRGKSFCSGADLGWMKSMAQYDLEQNRADSNALFDMFKAGWDIPLPLIGQVQGRIMGGALGLVSLCDVVVAESASLFCFSEVKLGLAPAVISSFIGQKMHTTAMSLYMMTGDVFDVNAAREAELIAFDEVGEAAVENRVQQLIASFCKAGPMAVSKTKALIRSNGKLVDWGEMKKYTTQVISELRVGEEGQEGLQSFFEKRQASFVAACKQVKSE